MNNPDFIYELKNGKAINLLDIQKVYRIKNLPIKVINSSTLLHELFMKKKNLIYGVRFYFEIETKDGFIETEYSLLNIFSKYDDKNDIPYEKNIHEKRNDLLEKWNDVLKHTYLKGKERKFQSSWKNKD